MSSRRTPKPLTMVVLIALGAGGASALSYGCGSNNSTSAANGADAAVEAGPPPPAGNLQCSADSTDWPMFGQNVCNTNSQATSGGISKDTVGTLGKKWKYSAKGDVSATPDRRRRQRLLPRLGRLHQPPRRSHGRGDLVEEIERHPGLVGKSRPARASCRGTPRS